GSPLLRPVVVSKHTGTGARSAAPPRQLAPTRPPVRWYGHVFARGIALIPPTTHGLPPGASSVPAFGRRAPREMGPPTAPRGGPRAGRGRAPPARGGTP